MALLRFILFVVLTSYSSFFGAMNAPQMPAIDHATHEAIAEEHLACCQDHTDRAQSCHALPAVLPNPATASAAPSSGEDVFCTSGVLLAGIQPSVSLDPPRAV